MQHLTKPYAKIELPPHYYRSDTVQKTVVTMKYDEFSKFRSLGIFEKTFTFALTKDGYVDYHKGFNVSVLWDAGLASKKYVPEGFNMTSSGYLEYYQYPREDIVNFDTGTIIFSVTDKITNERKYSTAIIQTHLQHRNNIKNVDERKECWVILHPLMDDANVFDDIKNYSNSTSRPGNLFAKGVMFSSFEHLTNSFKSREITDNRYVDTMIISDKQTMITASVNEFYNKGHSPALDILKDFYFDEHPDMFIV